MKNVWIKRHLSLLLALLMTVSVLLGMAACADTDKDGEAGDDTTPSSSQEEGINAAYDTVEKQKFNKDFVILTRGDMKEDMYVEKITGDVLDDKIVERNRAVEKDFGVTIKCETKDGYEAVNETVKTNVTSNIDDIDMYVGHKYSFNDLAQGGYCYDLNMVDGLDLTQPWWDQGCYDHLTVDGKTYLMTGDINPSSMRISSCFVFNKKMMESLGKKVQDLNDLTKNGGWTLDVLYSYTEGVTEDTSGDGKMNYQDDRYGLTAWMMDIPFSMFYGAGGMFVGTNESGDPELNYDSEQVFNIYEKMYNVIIGQKAYFVTDAAQYETIYDVFSEGRALFCDITLGKITTFISDMKEPYGILPTPKYDTAQKRNICPS